MSFSSKVNFLVWINSRIRIGIFVTCVRVKWYIMNVKLRSQLLRRSLYVIISVVEVVASRGDKRTFSCLRPILLVNSFVFYFFWLVLLLVNGSFFKFVLRAKSFFSVSVENLSFWRLLLYWISEFLVSGLNTLRVVHMQSTAWSEGVAKTLYFVYHEVFC